MQNKIYARFTVMNCIFNQKGALAWCEILKFNSVTK